MEDSLVKSFQIDRELRVIFESEGKEIEGVIFDKVLDRYLIKDNFGKAYTVEMDKIKQFVEKFPRMKYIYDKIEPLLSVEAKKILTNIIADPKIFEVDVESTESHLCVTSVSLSIPIYDIKNLERSFEDIQEYQYKRLVRLINKAVEEGILIDGVICPPIAMQLALISPAVRYSFFVYGISKVPQKELIARNTIFCAEGSFGRDLKSLADEEK